jgi:hypothetical protein
VSSRFRTLIGAPLLWAICATSGVVLSACSSGGSAGPLEGYGTRSDFASSPARLGTPVTFVLIDLSFSQTEAKPVDFESVSLEGATRMKLVSSWYLQPPRYASMALSEAGVPSGPEAHRLPFAAPSSEPGRIGVTAIQTSPGVSESYEAIVHYKIGGQSYARTFSVRFGICQPTGSTCPTMPYE